MSKQATIFGRLKYVEERQGFIYSMFCKGDEENSNSRLEFSENAKEMSNVEFKNKYAIYKNYELQKTKVAIHAEHLRLTSTGKPVMRVLSIKSAKDYYNEIQQETKEIQAVDNKYQTCIETLQNAVTLSFQAQKNALEEAEKVIESLKEMKDFLKMISSVAHSGTFMLEIQDNGKQNYGYILDFGEEPKRFYAQDLATLTCQITAFGEQMRRQRKEQNE